MNEWNKYWAIAWISAKSNLAYAGEVGSRLFFLSVILYIFMRLWQVTFHNASAAHLGGYSLPEMIWYLALTESILMSGPRLVPLIDEDVRTGAIAVQLVRPLSYPLYRLASHLGEASVRFFITTLAATLIASLLVGVPANLGQGAPLVVLALPLAFVLDFCIYLLVGLSAFWFEDTYGLMLIVSRLTMILGGMMLPLELFPAAIQPVLKSLPFGYKVCGPARLLVHPDWMNLAGLLVGQVLWIAVIGSAAAFVYSRGLKRISLNGG
jgi:ABC-2 type transport system permease protein